MLHDTTSASIESMCLLQEWTTGKSFKATLKLMLLFNSLSQVLSEKINTEFDSRPSRNDISTEHNLAISDPCLLKLKELQHMQSLEEGLRCFCLKKQQKTHIKFSDLKDN